MSEEKKPQGPKTWFDLVPDEVVLKVLTFLDRRSLWSIMRAYGDDRVGSIASDNSLWPEGIVVRSPFANPEKNPVPVMTGLVKVYPWHDEEPSVVAKIAREVRQVFPNVSEVQFLHCRIKVDKAFPEMIPSNAREIRFHGVEFIGYWDLFNANRYLMHLSYP
jgi:hypothetical protein